MCEFDIGECHLQLNVECENQHIIWCIENCNCRTEHTDTKIMSSLTNCKSIDSNTPSDRFARWICIVIEMKYATFDIIQSIGMNNMLKLTRARFDSKGWLSWCYWLNKQYAFNSHESFKKRNLEIVQKYNVFFFYTESVGCQLNFILYFIWNETWHTSSASKRVAHLNFEPFDFFFTKITLART